MKSFDSMMTAPSLLSSEMLYGAGMVPPDLMMSALSMMMAFVVRLPSSGSTSLSTSTRSSLPMPSNLRNMPAACVVGVAVVKPNGFAAKKSRSSTSPCWMVSPATPLARLDTLTHVPACLNSSPLTKAVPLAVPNGAAGAIAWMLLAPVPPPGSL
ncbi:hypothetical protein D3C86_1491120 [compost metagenome]